MDLLRMGDWSGARERRKGRRENKKKSSLEERKQKIDESVKREEMIRENV